MDREALWWSCACVALLACGEGGDGGEPKDGVAPPAPASAAGQPSPASGSAGVSAAAGGSAGGSAGHSANAGQSGSVANAGEGGAGGTAQGGGAGGSGPGVGDDAEYLGLAAPARGFRLVTRGREVVPQSDVEYCEIGELPGSPDQEYIVSAVESANAQGSHHLIVSIAAPGSAADRQLRARALGEQVPCIGASSEFGAQGITTFASTQTRYNKAQYPKGVAVRVLGGQRVVFDYHYFNFGDQPLSAKSALAVHELEPGEPATIASSFAFTNMTIDTPPGSEKTFTATCTFKHDVITNGIARHTHQRGTDFTVWFEGGARHGEQVWTSNDWEHELGHAFAEPRLFKAGEGFKFACSFRNEGSKPLRFGIRSTDEMCILAGAVWSPTPGVEAAPEECVVTWNDAQGMGHDADEDGGFPAADPGDALTCHAGSFGISFVEGCLGCICDSCATIMARCSADADCKPLLDCTSSCMGLEKLACNEKCEPLMFEHSSAVGMISQVGECIRSQCGGNCMPAMP